MLAVVNSYLLLIIFNYYYYSYECWVAIYDYFIIFMDQWMSFIETTAVSY